MAANGINLATGVKDREHVLATTAAPQQGKQVRIWVTKDAGRLGLPGELHGVVCKRSQPLEGLHEQFAEAAGELWLCPICLNTRDLGEAERAAGTDVVGATPTWQWAGTDATVFS